MLLLASRGMNLKYFLVCAFSIFLKDKSDLTNKNNEIIIGIKKTTY